MASEDPIEGLLWWKDSWSAAVNDYDLLLYHGVRSDSSHTRISRFELVRGYEGDARQWGRSGDKPYEEVYFPTAVPGDIYGWVIVNERPWALAAVSGQHGALPGNRTAVDFDFFCPNQDLLTYRPYRSIMTPADNESAGFVAVGATCAQWSIDPDYLRPGFAQQEPYSSEGPNVRGVNTVKLAGPDDVSSVVMAQPWPYGFGTSTFRGTSASSPPHASGIVGAATQRPSSQVALAGHAAAPAHASTAQTSPTHLPEGQALASPAGQVAAWSATISMRDATVDSSPRSSTTQRSSTDRQRVNVDTPIRRFCSKDEVCAIRRPAGTSHAARQR
jgi:hypothetical protein